MKAYIKNLQDPLMNKPHVHGVIAYCELCEYECSANKGDYWDWSDDEALKCPDCNEILTLAVKKTVYEPLSLLET